METGAAAHARAHAHAPTHHAHARAPRHRHAGVGFATDDVKPDRLPGWEPHSYGYHGDDGCAFHGSGQGREYGPKYGQVRGERRGPCTVELLPVAGGLQGLQEGRGRPRC